MVFLLSEAQALLPSFTHLFLPLLNFQAPFSLGGNEYVSLVIVSRQSERNVPHFIPKLTGISPLRNFLYRVILTMLEKAIQIK